VQSWDIANKGTELADYSVCTPWGIKDKHSYLIDVFRKCLDCPHLKRAVREQHRLHNASVVLIEDKASGTPLVQELILKGLHGVSRAEPTRISPYSSSSEV
jgi:phage terminase large subunit-like protein